MPQTNAAIVGIRFRPPEALDAVRRMKIGQTVRLVRDPDNVFDKNAVQVWFLGVQIGFIPRSVASRIASAIDQGTHPAAEIVTAPVVAPDGRVTIEPMLDISWSHPSLLERQSG